MTETIKNPELKYYIAIEQDDSISGFGRSPRAAIGYSVMNSAYLKTLECDKEIYDLLESYGYLPNPTDEPIWQYDPERKIAYIPKAKRENVWGRLPFLSED